MNKSDHISKEKYNYVGLLYFEGLTNEVSKILRKFNIGVNTYPHKTIGSILPQLKDSVVQFTKFLVKITRFIYSTVYW